MNSLTPWGSGFLTGGTLGLVVGMLFMLLALWMLSAEEPPEAKLEQCSSPDHDGPCLNPQACGFKYHACIRQLVDERDFCPTCKRKSNEFCSNSFHLEE